MISFELIYTYFLGLNLAKEVEMTLLATTCVLNVQWVTEGNVEGIPLKLRLLIGYPLGVHGAMKSVVQVKMQIKT